jgi:hypothetical protein
MLLLYQILGDESPGRHGESRDSARDWSWERCPGRSLESLCKGMLICRVYLENLKVALIGQIRETGLYLKCSNEGP